MGSAGRRSARFALVAGPHRLVVLMLRVTTVFSGVAGTPYYSSQFFGGSTEGEAVAAAQAVDDFWGALQINIWGVLQANQLPEVAQIDPATGQQIDAFPVDVEETDFTANQEPLPWATQGLIRLRTNTFVGGRRLQGRIFVPGLQEVNSIGGNPDASVLTALGNAANILATNGSTAGGLVVYSRTHQQAAAVTSVSVWNRWAVLRSRRD